MAEPAATEIGSGADMIVSDETTDMINVADTTFDRGFSTGETCIESLGIST